MVSQVPFHLEVKNDIISYSSDFCIPQEIVKSNCHVLYVYDQNSFFSFRGKSAKEIDLSIKSICAEEQLNAKCFD